VENGRGLCVHATFVRSIQMDG